MEKTEAHKILQQVCQQIRGTVQEHQVIQEALRTLAPVEDTKEE
jgi:ribosomal protein S7